MWWPNLDNATVAVTASPDRIRSVLLAMIKLQHDSPSNIRVLQLL